MDEEGVARVLADAEARLALRESAGLLAPSRRVPGGCPYCAATGSVPCEDFAETGALAKCLHCDGLGDLDGARLLAAYECGRRDALMQVGAYLREARLVLELGASVLEEDRAPVTGEQLRARVGG